MATKKEKLIEEAQKLALKGPVEKAIKAYEQLVSMEPAVLNHRQRLADLLIRVNRHDDARIELEVIGKNFSTNGFYLKAIAIYTKLKGLYPNDIPIALTLAGLNEKHGLTANALAEYKRRLAAETVPNLAEYDRDQIRLAEEHEHLVFLRVQPHATRYEQSP